MKSNGNVKKYPKDSFSGLKKTKQKKQKTID